MLHFKTGADTLVTLYVHTVVPLREVLEERSKGQLRVQGRDGKEDNEVAQEEMRTFDGQSALVTRM